MSKFRKILVAAVVLSMVLSLVGTGFAAAPKVVTKVFSDTQGKSCEQAMAMLGGLGIYKGDSGIGGPARPDDPITRAEVAAVITRMLGKEKTAKAMENYAPPFVDSAKIPSWAWGYVSVASSLGIVKGYPDGSFGPNNNVTHAEMLAMLVRALGHDSLVKGVWPTNYIVYGHSLGLTEGVEVFANLPATRGEVAIMAANAMEADVYDEVAEEVLEGESLLTGKLRSGFELVEGTVTDTAEDEITIDADDNELDGDYTLASQVVLVGVDKIADLENLEVKAVLVDDDVVYIEVTEEAEVVSGVLEDVDDDIDFEEIVLDGEDDYALSDSTEFYINGTPIKEQNVDGVTGNEDPWEVFQEALKKTDWESDISITLTLGEDDEGDEVVEVVKAEVFDVYDDAILDVEVDDDEDEDPLGTLELEDALDRDVLADTDISLDGEAAEFEDLEEDMVVYIATSFVWDDGEDDYVPGDEAYKIDAYSDSVTGEIDSLRKVMTGASKGYWKVTLVLSDDSEKTIRLSNNLVDYNQDPGAEDLTEGATVTLVLNADGYGRVVAESEGGEEIVWVTGLSVVEDEDVDRLVAITVERSGEEETIDTEDEGDWLVVDDTVYAASAPGTPLFKIEDFVQVSLNTKGELKVSGTEAAIPITDLTAGDGDGIGVYRVTSSESEVILAEYTLDDGEFDAWSAGKVVVENPLVYEEDEDGDWSYIGIDGLSQYDDVKVYGIDEEVKAIVKVGEIER